MIPKSSGLRILLLVVCCIGSCVVVQSFGVKWEVVKLPVGTKLDDVLVTNLYEPFDRSTLLENASDAYGEPTDSGSEGTSKDRVYFREYVGRHGRIRVYDEAYGTEDDWVSKTWLELTPGALYLKDVIDRKYLSGIATPQGIWKMYLRPDDRSWSVTLELNRRAVTKVVDQSK